MTTPKNNDNESQKSEPKKKSFDMYLSKILHSQRTGLSKKDEHTEPERTEPRRKPKP